MAISIVSFAMVTTFVNVDINKYILKKQKEITFSIFLSVSI